MSAVRKSPESRARNYPFDKPPEWKARWRAHIGGGRAAAAAGIHEYLTPLQLYLSMVDGVDLDLEANPNILRGMLLEPIALARLQMLHPELDIVPHDQDKFIHNPKYPHSSDLPDFWVRREGQELPGQVKCPTPENYKRLDEAIPAYIEANCIHSAAMNNAPAILLVCLHPVTMELFQKLYEPTKTTTDFLMEAEQHFAEKHLIPRIPPLPENQEDVKRLWPTHLPGRHVTAKEDIEQVHAELMPLKKKHAEQEDRIKELNLQITAYMGNAEVLKSRTGALLATYRSHPEVRLDSKKLKEKLPEVWNDFKQEKDVRVFLPKAPK